ncbi:LuxR C-terminal-related transcriptional regulator [Paenibacillus sp. 2TAB19]|uniref:LuxR C-terminal-related transcriptional regulator n=1 Tax=Paenibacillus sp. 2TAB19 TaxID=3233003 RepID=UPI003F9E7CF3
MIPTAGYILLKTKTTPPAVKSGLISRERLVAGINRSMQGRLTAVCAPAGYGKTTLLSQWISQCDYSVAWVALDEYDNDTIRFWRYVTQSLIEAADAVQAERLTELLLHLPNLSITMFIDVLINELFLALEPLALVWDDYQFIHLEDIHTSVVYFIDRLPKHVHVLLASRSELPFRVAKWTSRGEHTEVDARQLQFSLDEAESYYATSTAVALTRLHVESLHQRTEGWITALQLISISLEGASVIESIIDSFSGEHRMIGNYLFQEVLARLPEPVAQFLYRTSMLTRMDAELCDALAGTFGGSKMLEELKARNLFLVPLDENNVWFRYHHLFAEFLQNQSKKLHMDHWLAHNRNASISFAARGFMEEAIDYAVASGDFLLTEQLLEKQAPIMLRKGEFATLARWFDSFPAESERRTPEMGLLNAFILIVTGQAPRAEAMMGHIESQFANIEAGERRGQLHSGLLFVKSNLLFTSGLFEQWLSFAKTDSMLMLPQDSIYYNFNYNLSEPLVRRTSFGMKGVLTADTESIAHLFTGLLAAHNWNESLINLYVMQSLCEGYYEWNRLDRATAQIPAIDRAARAKRTLGLFIPNRITQAYIHMAEEDPELAHLTIDEALQLSSSWTGFDMHWRHTLIACKIRLYLSEGKLASAKKELPGLGVAPKDRPLFSSFYKYTTYVRVLAAQRKELDALRLLRLLRPQAEREACLVSLVEISILTACIEEQRGQRVKALHSLHAALVMTAPFGYMRSYLDEGDKLASLIRAYAKQREANKLEPALITGVSDEYMTALLAAFPTKPQEHDAASALPEPLSRGELQLLLLLRKGASNKQIAAALTLSEGTVKVYLSRIYGKLGVSSRTQALLAIQDLQLLDEE